MNPRPHLDPKLGWIRVALVLGLFAGCGQAVPLDDDGVMPADGGGGASEGGSPDAGMGSDDAPPPDVGSDAEPAVDAAVEMPLPPDAATTPPLPGRKTFPRILHTQEQLAFVRDKISKQVEPYSGAFSNLLGIAAGKVSEPISAVAIFEAPGTAEDRPGHDRAQKLIGDDAEAAYALALAWQLSAGMSVPNDQTRGRYLDQALEILRRWSQTNTGYAGLDGDLLMATHGVGFALAADLLWQSNVFTEAERGEFLAWLENVLAKAAESMKKRSNGWAGWGTLAALAAHGLPGNWQAVATDIDRLRELIDTRINPDGSMPRELERPDNTLWHTYNALVSLTASIEAARNLRNIDLYDWLPPTRGTVKNALDYFFQRGCLMPSTWPQPPPQVPMRPDGVGGNLIAPMGAAYDDMAFRSWAPAPNPWRASDGFAWTSPPLMPPRLTFSSSSFP